MSINISWENPVAVDFEIKFADAPALQCQLHDTDLARKYLNLLKDQYSKDPCPVFRDPQLYTQEHFASLIEQAKTVLGWDWQRDHYDVATTTLLHKDIEQYLARGYANIPDEHNHLLDELHYCLHAIESGSRRNYWLQIEWFNDEGFYIDQDEYPAKLSLEFGDLRLQNPYVGHHPLYLYEQQDSTNVLQTCRFHDFAKPGLNISIVPKSTPTPDWDQYLAWFETHAAEFVQEHGIEKLKKFTGHPVIGSVLNKKDLHKLTQQPVIEFESISFV